jgi:hypothetical protein
LTCWVEVSGGAAGGGVRDFNPAFRPGFAHGRAPLGELLQQPGDRREPSARRIDPARVQPSRDFTVRAKRCVHEMRGKRKRIYSDRRLNEFISS